MPLLIQAKRSADADNAVTFGADGGLYLPQSYVGGAGQSPSYMIDNNWGGPGQQVALPQPAIAFTSAVATLGTAILYPFAVTRTCRLAGAQINVATAAAGSSVYHSLFAADPSTGAPAGKLADLCAFATATAGLATATLLAANYMFTARALYWLCAWSYAAAPTISVRETTVNMPVRLTAAPTTVAGFYTKFNTGYPDTSVAWGTLTAAPATVAPTTTSQTAGWQSFTPLTHWLLTNV